MHPFNKNIKDITLKDIDTLIQDQVPESRILDYKRDLYTGIDKDKKDFLIDVSALANTVGGYLVIGVEESDGVPKSIMGVEIPEFDKLKLGFENLLRMSADPPIRGVEFQAVDIANNKKVLIIEVPRSVSRPHAVTFQKYHRFHGRNSSGTYPYEVDDIRRAILESETTAVKIRNFKNDRLALISSNEGIINLLNGPKLILHVIPFDCFDNKIYGISNVASIDIPPICINSWDSRINFDGFMTHFTDREDRRTVHAYTQLFNNGAIEAVDTFILNACQKGFLIQSLENYVVRALRCYVQAYNKYSINFPVWICLSLIGVKDFRLLIDGVLPSCNYHPIDRNELVLPEIFIESPDIPCETMMKPVFDMIWQACGFKRSFNYDESGRWTLQGK